MPRPRAPHGTYSAYKRHLREKTAVCELCEGARDERTAQQRESRRPAAVSVSVPPPDEGVSSDRRAQLERNLELVTAAMEHVAAEEPSKLAPLSKRHSELLAELASLDGAVVEEDPFDAFLSGSGNVIGFPVPSGRKQA